MLHAALKLYNLMDDIKCDAGNSGKDQVFGFGFGKRGQLGISTDKIKSVSLPQITFGLEDVQIARISANGDHSAALSGEPAKDFVGSL